MKTRNFLLGAMGLFAMASCSNDEVISVNHDGDEITFSVVTNSVSRAENVYCNANPPGTFYVWAKTTDGKTYINGDKIQKKEGTWVNKSGTRYWPAGDLNFYASVIANAVSEDNTEDYDENYKFIWNNNGSPTIDVTIPEAVTDQKDLLYAVKTGQNKANNSGTDKHVELNFRHALSQIVFEAKNTNPNLYVEIYEVSVYNVGSTATFTYPTGDTSTNMQDDDHDGNFSHTDPDGMGSWSDSNNKQNYTATLNNMVPLKGDKNATATPLTNNVKGTEFNPNAMLLLPQTTAAWTPTTNENPNGAYFRVKCKIYNVKDPSVESINVENEVCLWGADTDKGKDVAIPVALNWEQGKKYIYTFAFGDGNGGYNPDAPNDPVLVPITFKVTVDDFVSVTNTDQPTTL